VTSKTDIPFFLTPEQIAFANTLDRMLAERWPLEARRKPGWSPVRLWRDLADLGVLGLPFREEDGGLGGSPVDVMLVATTLGRHLVTLPYASSAAALAILLEGHGGEATRRIIAGESTVALTGTVWETEGTAVAT